MCRPATITWRTAPTTSTGRRATCPKDLVRHQSSGADRRRVVRRAGLLRSVPHVSRAEGEESRRTRRRSPSARGCTAGGPRATATRSGHISFGSKTAAHYRASIELPFFNFYLEGQRAPESRGGGRVRDRRQPVARLSASGRRQARGRATCICRSDGQLSFTAPGRSIDDAFDDYVQRSREAGAAYRRGHDHRRTSLHGRGSAVRRGPARTCSSTRRRRSTDGSDDRRADRRQPATWRRPEPTATGS